MKYIDLFLKKLKTNRTTFATYILTLISIYICVDRLAEILFIMFSGLGVDYWGPIKYTFAIACPVFAFYFSFASKFAKDKLTKSSLFYTYTIALFLVILSMAVQWANYAGWVLLFSVPNYSYIISTFMDLIRPAFSAVGWYIPLCSFYPLLNWLIFVVNDTLYIQESIWEYGGINLDDNSEGTGPYTCEIFLCKDTKDGKSVIVPEARRFESTLIVGVSGSGKTTMVFEPMIARDIEKKYFFKENAKELAFTALKTNIATLNCPYSNDYINENFSLNMISPASNKEKLFKTFFEKMIYNYSPDQIVYKDLGITYLAPDPETISRITNVAKNFGVKYNLIDPNDPNSVGLNPFTFEDPIKTSISISAILKRLYASGNTRDFGNTDDAFMHNFSMQAVENLSILLKEMYPRTHERTLPNLEDLLELLNDFTLIEKMAEEMKAIPELAEKYKILLGYLKKTFYSNAKDLDTTSKYLLATATQIENLLRYPGVRNVLCNRTNNVHFDKALANGEVTLVCTRRGDLGPGVHRAFGLFFILLMQQSVLTRPGNEKTRIPHFFYIDEFPPFATRATIDIFTLYRKYKVGTIISSQNLSQFGRKEDGFAQTLLANCTTKVIFGNNTPEDNAWWELELAEKRRWTFSNDYKTDIGKYDSNYKGIKWSYVPNFKAGKVQSLKFKNILYKTKNLKGALIVGPAKVDFLESRYKEKQKFKTFNFSKFTNGISSTSDSDKKKNAFHINYNTNPNNPNDIDPIQYTANHSSDEEGNAIKKFNTNKN